MPKNRLLHFLSLYWRTILVTITPIVLLPVLIANNYEMEFKCLYIVLIMCIYWVTEALPLPITSFIPIVLFPAFGIMSTDATCKMYLKETLLMFLGGIIIALAVEYCNLHKRVALKFIDLIGCSQRRLHFGLFMVTAFISMWIANVAACAMMCPVIQAVLEELEAQGLCKLYENQNQSIEDGNSLDIDQQPNNNKEKEDDVLPYPTKITLCYFLGVAYASTLGGCGTLIGTSTNLTAKGIFETRFPIAPGIEFGQWFLFNTPVMMIYTVLTWLYLQWLYMGLFNRNSNVNNDSNNNENDPKEGELIARKIIQRKYDELGPMTAHEWAVMILFFVAITLFFTRSPGFIQGWAKMLTTTIKIQDGTPAIFIVILFFIIPSNWNCLKFFQRNPSSLPKTASTGLITWKFINSKVPWGLIFLLGGGFALAEGGRVSGMTKMIGEALSDLKSLPPVAILFLVCLTAQILTEFTSNVAIANLLLPVLAEMAIIIKMHPLYLMLPAALSCSMAFHMPVGTPANAVVAGIANIRTKDMAIAGIGPTLATLVCIWASFPTWGAIVYPEIYADFPEWAATNISFAYK